MTSNQNIYFEDKDFPINIIPNRTSVIDKIEDGRCAIHKALELKYFYEGSSTLLVGNDAIIATAGDVIIINPYEFHATINYSEEKGKYHLIMVDPDFFPPLPEMGSDLETMFFSERRSFINQITDSQELRNLLSSVVDEYKNQQKLYKLRIRGLMLEVLAILLRYGTKSTQNTKSEQIIRHHSTIVPALSKIRNEYKNDLSLDELAEVCCVNKYYFCRIFKEAMGVTPMQYLCDYRLNHADIIIRNTDKSISDIIADCGFNDESYFYKCYKKHFGVTPYSRRTKK